MFRRSLNRRLRKFWITEGRAANTRRIGEIIFWFSRKVYLSQRLPGRGTQPFGIEEEILDYLATHLMRVLASTGEGGLSQP
jgi:hypothetical protein